MKEKKSDSQMPDARGICLSLSLSLSLNACCGCSQGVKQAAYAEIDHGVDENMRELAADVKDRAVADLEVLREVMKERMEERYAKSLSRREHIEAAARAPSST